MRDLYEGVHDQPPWGRFLERFRSHLGSVNCALTLRPAYGPAVEYQAGDRPPALHRLMAEHMGTASLPHREMREARVYAIEELIDPTDARQRAFVAELARAWGVDVVRLMRVVEPGGVEIWISCAGRRLSGGAVSAQMHAFAPHLRVALRSFVALERERFRFAASADAFGRLGFGWLALDAQCRITDLTPGAEHFLYGNGPLRRGPHDRLMLASTAADRLLVSLVRLYADRPDAAAHAIALTREPAVDLLLRPLAERAATVAAPPVAIAYVSGGGDRIADRSGHLVELFGLLPSEARFAWAMARGLSIAEAARELGLTIESARGYSKKIYAKTGTRGQADLLRLMLTGVLALA
ncbi:MAG: helix-turn-helix transcriptional regulator [Sphingobium sp.]